MDKKFEVYKIIKKLFERDVILKRTINEKGLLENHNLKLQKNIILKQQF